MSNTSNEILAKTLGIWCADFSACIKEKTESFSKILEMFGLSIEEFQPIPEVKTSAPSDDSPKPVLADVHRAAAVLEKEKCGRAVRNLMRKYGIDNLNDLDSGMYADFIKDAEELADEPC